MLGSKHFVGSVSSNTPRALGYLSSRGRNGRLGVLTFLGSTLEDFQEVSVLWWKELCSSEKSRGAMGSGFRSSFHYVLTVWP